MHSARAHATHRIWCHLLCFGGAWRGAIVGIHEFLNRNCDLATVLAVRRIESHQHQLHQNLRVHHDARTFTGSHSRFVFRQLLAQFFVGRVFVTQAAHEPTATTRDLHRIKRGLLHFGRAHRNRLEHLEEVLAATVLTATLVVGDQTRFITRTDLTHLDATVVLVGQTHGEIAEVNALVAQVIDQQERFIEGELEVDDFGGKALFCSDFTHAAEFGAAAISGGRRTIEIFNRGDAQDFAVGLEGIVAAAGVLDIGQHLGARDALAATRISASGGEHLGEFDGAKCSHHHLRTAARLGIAAVGILAHQLHSSKLHHDR